MTLLPASVHDYFRAGWSQFLPPEALLLQNAVALAAEEGCVGELDEQPAGSPVGSLIEQMGGYDGSAWASTEGVFDDHPDDLEQARLLAEGCEQVDRFGRELGLGSIRTVRDLLGLMQAVGLIERVDEDGEVRWRPADDIPLPEDKLALTAEEKAAADRRRWQDVHYQGSQRVIRFFVDRDIEGVTASLAAFAAELEMDPEDVRQAILVLLDEGDFSASVDIERVEATNSFDLKVDWERFERTRIGVKLAPPGDAG